MSQEASQPVCPDAVLTFSQTRNARSVAVPRIVTRLPAPIASTFVPVSHGDDRTITLATGTAVPVKFASHPATKPICPLGSLTGAQVRPFESHRTRSITFTGVPLRTAV